MIRLLTRSDAALSRRRSAVGEMGDGLHGKDEKSHPLLGSILLPGASLSGWGC